MEPDTFRLSNIPLVQVDRIPTGNSYLDACYGFTQIRADKIEYGLPDGAISLWAGSPGIGKSTLCINVAADMNKLGYRIFYIQNEVSAKQFKQWTENKILYPKDFIVHLSNQIDRQVKMIEIAKPHLIIVDSLNMINGFQSPLIMRKVLQAYKDVSRIVHAHTILIGHLNKAGTVKGNNDIEYLVDIECALQGVKDRNIVNVAARKMNSPGFKVKSMFFISFNKNRFGATSSNGQKNYVCFAKSGFNLKVVSSNIEDEE